MKQAASILLFCSLTACESFEAAQGGPVDGGASGTNDAAPPDAASPGAKQAGCPKPLPANTKCWDFDEGDAPGGEKKSGELALDSNAFFSPERSLLASTTEIGASGEAWAYAYHAMAKAPKSLVLDMRFRVPKQAALDIAQIRIEGTNGVYHSFAVSVDDGNMRVIEATFITNDAEAHVVHPLGSANDTWQHLVITVSMTGLGTSNAKRHLKLELDGATVYDADGTFALDKLTPVQSFVRFGIAHVHAYGAASGPPRRVNVDDVSVSWEP